MNLLRTVVVLGGGIGVCFLLGLLLARITQSDGPAAFVATGFLVVCGLFALAFWRRIFG
ncbi:hypothetical protein [Haloarchaeobius sp. DFWS5]|uniref:hypothetical protein n=1 Tax=Haloarchaeobius sp. DFWS5 TaxID=3446114 RepID=UPI003EB7059F